MTPQPPPGQGPAMPPGGGFPPQRGPMTPMGPMGPMGGMPPMMMMPPPPRRGGIGGSFVGAFLGVMIGIAFLISVIFNLYLMAVVGVNESQASETKAIETPIPALPSGDDKQKIAVVRFSGEITDQSKRPFVLLLEQLRRDADVKALVLEIDSPGGAVTPSDELYDALMRLKKEKNIPIVVSMGSLAASGGYYMAMSGDKIFAQETTLTGSIGVLFSRTDISELAEKYGVKDGTIVSDGATFKNSGSMYKALNPEELAYFKSLLNDAFAVFKSRVAAGRHNMTVAEIDAVANGKIYTAKQALQLKLIDKVGYLEDAIAEAATLAKLTSPHAVRVERQLSFVEQLMGATAGVGPTQSKVSASINGVNVSIDRETIDSFTRPRMMYMWQGQ